MDNKLHLSTKEKTIFVVAMVGKVIATVMTLFCEAIAFLINIVVRLFVFLIMLPIFLFKSACVIIVGYIGFMILLFFGHIFLGSLF